MGAGPSGEPAAGSAERGGGRRQAQQAASSPLPAGTGGLRAGHQLRAALPLRRLQREALIGPCGAVRHGTRAANA
eukprot:15465074-Alexandrium_andersonii.AAC.1